MRVRTEYITLKDGPVMRDAVRVTLTLFNTQTGDPVVHTSWIQYKYLPSYSGKDAVVEHTYKFPKISLETLQGDLPDGVWEEA